MGGDHGTRSVERAAAPHPGGRGAARRGLSAACGLPGAAAAGALTVVDIAQRPEQDAFVGTVEFHFVFCHCFCTSYRQHTIELPQ